MKTFMLIAALAGIGWSLGGCASQEPQDEAQTYQCPSCKETIQWRYHPSGKPWLTEKVVVHQCPDCKKEWGANLSMQTTCEMCKRQHLECPMCKKHGA